MKGQRLPADHHVVRLVSYTRLELDDDGKPIGILYTAFQRKPNEEGLSVTWMEYFAGERATKITSAVQAIRASNIKPSSKSAFAIGRVGAISDACAARDHKIRVIHWPEDDNRAHAEVRQIPRDDRELLEQLAQAEWSEFVLNSEIPAGENPAPQEPG